MTTTKESIRFTRELTKNVAEREKSGLPDETITADCITVAGIINMQAEHLQNTSFALVIQAEQLKSDLESKDKK